MKANTLRQSFDRLSIIMSPPLLFIQSLPLCYALSAIGGILEVGSTAVLAVPDAREKEGIKLPCWLPKVALASNVVMQLIGSLSSVSA